MDRPTGRVPGIENYDVLEGMADWVRIINDQYEVIYANPSMKDALGEDIVGRPCYASFDKNETCKFCISKRTIDTGEVIQMEEEHLGRFYSVKSSPIKDEQGKVCGAVEVFRDVTRERKLEQVLIERNKNIRADIGFARKLQEKLLPERDVVEGLCFDYVYLPSQLLSGDIFDIIPFDDNSVGMYMADVVGHGVSASMMTLFIYHAVRTAAMYTHEPHDLLKLVHRRFVELDLGAERYFSLLFARYDIKTGKFSFSNAGHNCAPLILSDGKVEVLEQFGYPIMNLREELNFENSEVVLKPEDRVLFYTDGIMEMHDASGQMLGIEGVISLYREFGTLPLHDFFQHVIRFSWGEQRDDYAMMQMQIKECHHDR